MSSYGNNSTRRVRIEDLRVDSNAHPEWISGTDRLPIAGEQVFCTEGLASVVKVLGKTEAGGRLLELKLLNGASQPFFVAAANVRVPPKPVLVAADAS